MNICKQNGADRLDGRVRQQQFDIAAAVFHVDAQAHQDRGVGRARDGGKARIGLQPVDVEFDRRQRLEGELGVGQHHFDHALDQIGLDGGVGPALHAHRALSAPAAEQHVDDRIDQARIDGGEAEIVPLLGLEHGEDRRQRDRIEIVAEAHRGDAVERDFDVVGGEIAQRGRHQPHQAVEDDFQHRQAFVGHHRRVDDGADAGIVVQRDVGQAEAEQAVDFILIEDALGAAACRSGSRRLRRPSPPIARPPRRCPASRWAASRGRAARRLLFQRHAPFGGQRVLIDLVFGAIGYVVIGRRSP